MIIFFYLSYHHWSLVVTFGTTLTLSHFRGDYFIVGCFLLFIFANGMFTYRGGFRLLSICSQDPNKNKIQRLADVSGTQGVVEGSLGLADKPLFGDWTIVVKLQVSLSCTMYVVPFKQELFGKSPSGLWLLFNKNEFQQNWAKLPQGIQKSHTHTGGQTHRIKDEIIF